MGSRVDQLGPVDTGEIEPSTSASTVGANDHAQVAVVDDKLVVLDPSTGHRALLNASAALVFTAFDTARRLGDVIEQLVDETGMAADDLAPDVLDTVDRLLAQGLLARGDVATIPQWQQSVSASTPGDGAEDPTLGRVWAFDSGIRVAAGIPVVVRIESAALAADIDAALDALPSVATPTNEYAVTRIEVIAGTPSTPPTSDEPKAQIVVDGEVRSNRVPRHNAAAYLFDQLDAVLADDTPGLRFHAGAVERDGDVVVVLGQSGHGKSTLTAALVQAGWGYLSDELVAVDAATFDVAPYARPLDLNRYSLDQLGLDGADIVTGSRKDKVFPGRLGRVSAGGRVAAIIVLTGESTEDGQLVTELPAAEAVMAMLALTFAATFDDAGALESLARLCVATPTMRLYRAPIAEMVRAVEGVIASAPSSGPIGAVTS
jgi:hypothetical protein